MSDRCVKFREPPLIEHAMYQCIHAIFARTCCGGVTSAAPEVGGDDCRSIHSYTVAQLLGCTVQFVCHGTSQGDGIERTAATDDHKGVRRG